MTGILMSLRMRSTGIGVEQSESFGAVSGFHHRRRSSPAWRRRAFDDLAHDGRIVHDEGSDLAHLDSLGSSPAGRRSAGGLKRLENVVQAAGGTAMAAGPERSVEALAAQQHDGLLDAEPGPAELLAGGFRDMIAEIAGRRQWICASSARFMARWLRMRASTDD